MPMQPIHSGMPPYVSRLQPLPRGASEAEIPEYGSLPLRSPGSKDYDPTPVLAALEQLAAQQAAIEWLREADLFRLILV